jgi:hypothetical protein
MFPARRISKDSRSETVPVKKRSLHSHFVRRQLSGISIAEKKLKADD